MTYKATGIIIRKADIREADRLFTIYTREYGKIEVLAQGVRKLSSKLSGNLELLNVAVFTIAKGKQLDRIATVDIRDGFERIKGNLDRLTVALAAVDLVNTTIKPQSPESGMFEVIYDLLTMLDQTEDIVYSLLLDLFTAKVAIILGYRPNVRQAEALLEKLESQSFSEIHASISARDPLARRIFRQSKLALLDRPLTSSAYTDHFEKSATTQNSRRP